MPQFLGTWIVIAIPNKWVYLKVISKAFFTELLIHTLSFLFCETPYHSDNVFKVYNLAVKLQTLYLDFTKILFLNSYQMTKKPTPKQTQQTKLHRVLRLWGRMNKMKITTKMLFYLPLSPPPNDHTVLPSLDRAIVCELPQETSPTLLISFTKVGMLRLLLSPWPKEKRKIYLLFVKI